MVSGFKSQSYTTVKPIVRATEHKTHWQTFGRGDRIYYGDRRHDGGDTRLATNPLGPVSVRYRKITYRMVNGEAVRV